MDEQIATVIANLEQKVEDLSALSDALSKKLDEIFQAIDETYEQITSVAGFNHDLDSVITKLARIHGDSEVEWRA